MRTGRCNDNKTARDSGPEGPPRGTFCGHLRSETGMQSAVFEEIAAVSGEHHVHGAESARCRVRNSDSRPAAALLERFAAAGEAMQPATAGSGRLFEQAIRSAGGAMEPAAEIRHAIQPTIRVDL